MLELLSFKHKVYGNFFISSSLSINISACEDAINMQPTLNESPIFYLTEPQIPY